MAMGTSRSSRLTAALSVFVTLAAMAGAAAAQETATAGVAFLKHAPKGTWAAVHIDGKQLATSQLVQNLAMMSGQDPAELNELADISIYVLPLDGPIGPGMKLAVCGAIKPGPEAQADAEKQLATEAAEKLNVDGMTAYRMPVSKLRKMVGAATPMGTQDSSVYVAQAADGTFLLGSDEAALKAARDAADSSSSPALPGLTQAVGGRADNSICAAAFVEGGLKSLIPPDKVQGTPTFVQNMKGAGIGLKADTGLTLEVELLAGSSEEANTILGTIQRQLTQTKQQLTARAQQNPGVAPIAQQVTPLIDKITAKTEGSSVLIGVNITQAEIGQLMMAGMMMMQGMQAGPGAPAPGAMPGGMGGF